jgi:hypothetical protein
MNRLLPLLLCCSCVGFHEPGSLDHAFAVGPVDLEVTRVYYPETPPDGVMLEYRFGNRLDHGVPFDLAHLEVDIDGLPGIPYDPRGELHAARLGPKGYGRERIVYQTQRFGHPFNVCVWLEGQCREVKP